MKIATHDGVFHTDEVFATALLQAVLPETKLTRSRQPDILASQDIVYDIGGIYDVARGRFDHHMADFDERTPSGVLLSSFGLLWREYGQQYCDGNAEVAELVRLKLVEPVDALDNGQEIYEATGLGVQPFILNDAIKAFQPVFGEEQDFEDGFLRAVEWAAFILRRTKAKALSELLARDLFAQAYSQATDKRLVVLDKPLPISAAVDYPDCLLVVMPGSDQADWIVRAVPVDKGSFACRRLLPETWAGLTGSDLEQASGVSGAVFCHRGRWVGAARGKEAAIQLACATLA